MNSKIFVLFMLFTLLSFSPTYISLNQENKIKIVTSIEVLSSIAKEIGGEFVDTDWILPPGATPHDYSPTPEDLEKIKSADMLIFANTSFFSLESKLKNEASDGTLILDASDYAKYNLTILEIPNFGKNYHGFWIYPNNALAIATAIKNALIKLDPSHTTMYEDNYQEFIYKVKKLKDALISEAKENNLYGYSAVVSVPGAAYVAEAFGIHVEATLMGGPQTTVNSSLVTELIKKAHEGIIKAIFSLENLRGTAIDETSIQFAKDAGIPIIYVRIFDSIINDYFALMEFNIGAVANHSESRSSETPAFLYVVLGIITVIALLEGIILFRITKEKIEIGEEE